MVTKYSCHPDTLRRGNCVVLQFRFFFRIRRKFHAEAVEWGFGWLRLWANGFDHWRGSYDRRGVGVTDVLAALVAGESSTRTQRKPRQFGAVRMLR